MDLKDYRLGVGAIILDNSCNNFYLFERVDFSGNFQFPEGGLDFAEVIVDNKKIDIKFDKNLYSNNIDPKIFLTIFYGEVNITNDIIFKKLDDDKRLIIGNDIVILPKINQYLFNFKNTPIAIQIKRNNEKLLFNFYKIIDNNPVLEDELVGIYREIWEEIGVKKESLELINSTKDFIVYNFSMEKVNQIKFFRVKGQAKKFFVFKTEKNIENEFDFISNGEQEFKSFIKIPLNKFLENTILMPKFKIEFYKKVFSELF